MFQHTLQRLRIRGQFRVMGARLTAKRSVRSCFKVREIPIDPLLILGIVAEEIRLLRLGHKNTGLLTELFVKAACGTLHRAHDDKVGAPSHGLPGCHAAGLVG